MTGAARRACNLLICASAGVVASLLVAWAGAVVFAERADGSAAWVSGGWRPTDPRARRETVGPSEWRCTMWWADYIAVREDADPRWYEFERQHEGWGPVEYQGQVLNLQMRTGWPLRCMEAVLAERGAAAKPGPLKVPRWLSGSADWIIPTRPLWGAFAINAAMYGLLFGVLVQSDPVRRFWALTERLRHGRVLRRAGVCVRCGYPVGSEYICSECGAPVFLPK